MRYMWLIVTNVTYLLQLSLYVAVALCHIKLGTMLNQSLKILNAQIDLYEICGHPAKSIHTCVGNIFCSVIFTQKMNNIYFKFEMDLYIISQSHLMPQCHARFNSHDAMSCSVTRWHAIFKIMMSCNFHDPFGG